MEAILIHGDGRGPSTVAWVDAGGRQVPERELLRAGYIYAHGNEEGEADDPAFDFAPYVSRPGPGLVIRLDGRRG